MPAAAAVAEGISTGDVGESCWGGMVGEVCSAVVPSKSLFPDSPSTIDAQRTGWPLDEMSWSMDETCGGMDELCGDVCELGCSVSVCSLGKIMGLLAVLVVSFCAVTPPLLVSGHAWGGTGAGLDGMC